MGLFSRKRKKRSEDAFVDLAVMVNTKAAELTMSTCRALGIADDPNLRWRVHTEALGVMSHLLSRFAFGLGGSGFQAEVQDSMVNLIVGIMVDASWDTRTARPGIDAQDWKLRMQAEVLHNVNAAEFEYGECKEVLSTGEDMAWLAQDETVVGRFGRIIAETIEASDDEYVVRLLAAKELLGVGLHHDFLDQLKTVQQK